MKYTGNGYEMSTGRKLYANRGLLSVMPDAKNEPAVYDGYDGCIEGTGRGDWEDEMPFTPEERREMADYVIAQWNKWADQG